MKKFTAVLLSVLLLASSLPISALASEASETSETVAADIVKTEPETTDSVMQPIKNTTTAEKTAVDEKPTEATPAAMSAKAAEPVGAKQAEQPVGKSSFTYTVTNNQVTITGLSDEYLTDLVIPETIEDLPVTAIKGSAFSGCSQVTSITVPKSVTSIGNGAFYGTKPTKVTLPFIGNKRGQTASYSSVFGYIFGGTNSSSTETTTQNYNSSNSDSSYYFIPKTIKEVVITDETIIPYGAFYNCNWIEKIDINENVTELGIYSFYNCSSLHSFTIPNLITEIKEASLESVGR